ncbi:MAG TPA: type II toxin-antitoxin system HicB family antitoxin [Nitrososphaerales archaeon]|nr:type II toxin-antitoxin system HicB family antitoxin [Nitrososphaerales archaeon]
MGVQLQERIFNVVVEKDEDGCYVGSVVELPGCHMQAKTLDELSKSVEEVIEGYLEVSFKGGGPEFVGVQQLKLRLTH